MPSNYHWRLRYQNLNIFWIHESSAKTLNFSVSEHFFFNKLHSFGFYTANLAIFQVFKQQILQSENVNLFWNLQKRKHVSTTAVSKSSFHSSWMDQACQQCSLSTLYHWLPLDLSHGVDLPMPPSLLKTSDWVWHDIHVYTAFFTSAERSETELTVRLV